MGAQGSKHLTSSIAAIAIAAVLMATAATAAAKTYEVNRRTDPAPGACTKNHCTLREAVIAANARIGLDRVELPSGKQVYRLGQPGTGEDSALTGDLDITDPLVVGHRGARRAEINGSHLDRVFEIHAGAPTTIEKLLIVGGETFGSDDGGAIRAESKLVVEKSAIRGNHAVDAGGGIYAFGTVAIRNSKLIRNSSLDGSGALEALGPKARIVRTTIAKNTTTGEGGSSYLSTDATVIRSELIENHADLRGGALYLNDGSLTIRRSTLRRNSTDTTGGAVMSFGDLTVDSSAIYYNSAGGTGGGVHQQTGSLAITNSTVGDNESVEEGGGLHIQQVPDARLNSVTVARNTANTDEIPLSQTGGGISNIDSSVLIRNSLLALNKLGPGPRNDCSGTLLMSQRNNLVSTFGPSGVCNGFGPGDLLRSKPKLYGLGKWGGPTATFALRPNSPAIDAAHRGSSPSRDQRGRKRDKKPDIGAYEDRGGIR